MYIFLAIIICWGLLGLLTSIFTTFFYFRGFKNLGEWVNLTNTKISQMNEIEPEVIGISTSIALIIIGPFSILVLIGLIITVNEYIQEFENNKGTNENE